MKHARDRAGSGDELARRLRPILGENAVGGGAINAWVQGRNETPGSALFAMMRVDDGLSLDEFALSDGDRATLQQQIDELRREVGQLRREMEERLADAGKEPLDIPGA